MIIRAIGVGAVDVDSIGDKGSNAVKNKCDTL